MRELKDSNVIVTGGAGFLGRHIVARLKDKGANVFVPRKRQYDLTNLGSCLQCLTSNPCDVLIHAAAHYGGIGINQEFPATIYYENLVMGANVFEAARLSGVEKVVIIGTACAYPGYLEGDLNEQDFWSGPCHSSVACYGTVKRMLHLQGQAYKKQYGLASIHLVPTNLYGPWDSYNPERSHVVAALVRKFVEAKLSDAPEIEVWGTGRAIREFIYVDDAAEAIIRATTQYDTTDLPLNIGTGIGTSIRELVRLITHIVDYRGAIIWNTSRPDGAPKKVLSVARMHHFLDWNPPTDLHSGLAKTLEWYFVNKSEADSRW